MPEAEFLTIPEVAALLRIGERTTYDLARQGKLGGAVKVGSQWRVDRQAFRRWIERSGEGTSRPSRRRKGKAS
jgi:excisionase family DNA binding protein